MERQTNAFFLTAKAVKEIQTAVESKKALKLFRSSLEEICTAREDRSVDMVKRFAYGTEDDRNIIRKELSEIDGIRQVIRNLDTIIGE